jgi:hypothetical protein
MLGATEIDLNEQENLPTAIQQVAQTIASEIQNNLEGGTLGNYILGSGGGWQYIRPYIEEHFGDQLLDSNDFPAARKVEPWMRNVVGLKRYELLKVQNGRSK